MVTVDFRRLDIRPGIRVLDVGCGSGRHTAAAYRLPRAQVVGLDKALPDLIAAADRLRLHDRLAEHGGGRWALCAADGLDLPFRDAVFDLVICSEVLEHVRDHRQAVQEITRVLKSNGELVVSVPRQWPERICWRLSPSYAATEGGHIRIYARRELAALLVNAGVEIRASHHAHSLHTPYWWLKCLTGIERENVRPVCLYHRFLTWDVMRQPRATRLVERLLNPLLGKSWVVYGCKTGLGGLRPATCSSTPSEPTRGRAANRPDLSACR